MNRPAIPLVYYRLCPLYTWVTYLILDMNSLNATVSSESGKLPSQPEVESWLRRIFRALAFSVKSTSHGFPADSITRLDTDNNYFEGEREPLDPPSKSKPALLNRDIDMGELALEFVSHLDDDYRAIFWDRLAKNKKWGLMHKKYGDRYSLSRIKTMYYDAVLYVAFKTLDASTARPKPTEDH